MEETLDPRDWNEYRALGHRMMDDMFEYMETLREHPAWQPYPDAALQAIGGALPLEEGDPAQVYANFQENILPYPNGNLHPRFWGWVQGNGTPLGVLSEMLAATMNSNVGGGNHSAAYVEAQVIRWLAEIFGFPREASGILLSGGSMATRARVKNREGDRGAGGRVIHETVTGDEPVQRLGRSVGRRQRENNEQGNGCDKQTFAELILLEFHHNKLSLIRGIALNVLALET